MPKMMDVTTTDLTTPKKVWKPKKPDPNDAGTLPSLFAASIMISSVPGGRKPAWHNRCRNTEKPSSVTTSTSTSASSPTNRSVGHYGIANTSVAVSPSPAFKTAVASVKPHTHPAATQTSRCDNMTSKNDVEVGVESGIHPPSPVQDQISTSAEGESKTTSPTVVVNDVRSSASTQSKSPTTTAVASPSPTRTRAKSIAALFDTGAVYTNSPSNTRKPTTTAPVPSPSPSPTKTRTKLFAALFDTGAVHTNSPSNTRKPTLTSPGALPSSSPTKSRARSFAELFDTGVAYANSPSNNNRKQTPKLENTALITNTLGRVPSVFHHSTKTNTCSGEGIVNKSNEKKTSSLIRKKSGDTLPTVPTVVTPADADDDNDYNHDHDHGGPQSYNNSCGGIARNSNKKTSSPTKKKSVDTLGTLPTVATPADDEDNGDDDTHDDDHDGPTPPPPPPPTAAAPTPPPPAPFTVQKKVANATTHPTIATTNNDNICHTGPCRSLSPLPMASPDAIAAAQALLESLGPTILDRKRPVDPNLPTDIVFDPSKPHEGDDSDFELASTAYSCAPSQTLGAMEEIFRQCKMSLCLTQPPPTKPNVVVIPLSPAKKNEWMIIPPPSARRTTKPLTTKAIAPTTKSASPAPALALAPLKEATLQRPSGQLHATPPASPGKSKSVPQLQPLSPIEQHALMRNAFYANNTSPIAGTAAAGGLGEESKSVIRSRRDAIANSPFKQHKPKRNMAMSPLSPVERKQVLATLLARKMSSPTTTTTTPKRIPTVDIMNDNDDDDRKKMEFSTIDPRELAQTDKVRKALMMAADSIGDGSVSSEFDRAERRRKLGTMNSRTGTSKTVERDIHDKMNHFFSIHSNKSKGRRYDDDDDDDVEISSSESEVSYDLSGMK